MYKAMSPGSAHCWLTGALLPLSRHDCPLVPTVSPGRGAHSWAFFGESCDLPPGLFQEREEEVEERSAKTR